MIQRLLDFVIQRKITQRNSRKRRLLHTRVEALESRLALSASPGTVTLDGGQLTICGDDADNRIIVAEVNGQVFVAADFLETAQFFPVADVTSIEVTGGAGNDLIWAPNMTSAMTMDGEAGDDQVFGGSAADTINGGDGNDLLSGGGGVDTINGGLGDDVVIAGEGNDNVNGGEGNDTLIGENGDDSLNGDEGNDMLLGAAGNDTVGGGAGDDTLVGGLGNDALTGSTGIDRLFGVDGDDELEGGDDDDLIFGGSGQDTISGELGDDGLVGGNGVDVISGGDGNDNLFGGSDRDVLIGGSGGDELSGNDGEDVLVSGSSSVESNIPALAALSSVWDSSESYDDRVAELQQELGTTSDDDAGTDTLRGQGGTDWFITSGATDELVDQESGETAAGRELVAINDTYEVNQGETFSALLANGLLSNDLNPGTGNLTLNTTPVTSPQSGTLTLFADGTFTYIHDGIGSTSDSFVYEVTAEDGSTDQATVKINVAVANTAPVASDDSLSGDEDTELTTNVLTNDTDANGDTITATLLTQPTNGTATLLPDGSLTYTPNTDFSGTDSLTYEVSDPDGLTSQATVTITVNATNDAPVAQARTFTTNPDTAFSTSAGTDDLLTSATDAEGDSLTASLQSQPANGTVTLNPNGTFTYTPDSGFNGTDSFTYVVNDGQSDSAPATVTVNVNPPNTFTVAETLADGSRIGTVESSNLTGPLSFEFADAASSDSALQLVPDDHYSGNLNAPIVMIEYLDFQCIACAGFHPTVQELKEAFPNDLLVVTRHLPLESIHPNAVEAAIAAEAAGEQGMFAEMEDILFTRRLEWVNEQSPTSVLEGYATELGLDLTQFRATMNDPATEARIRRDQTAATSELGLGGTPAVFIDGTPYTDVRSTEAISSLINDRLDDVSTPFTINRATGEIRVRESVRQSDNSRVRRLDFETTPTYAIDVLVSDGTTTETQTVTINLSDINDESAIPALPSDAVIQTTASGLQFYDFEIGDGESPELTDRVDLSYVGYLPNGDIFDGNEFASFGLNQVIDGFAEGLDGMNVGGRRRIIIPPELGYGSGGNPGAGIGGTDTIVFDVVLFAIQ
ncbi:MAG: Ig-like domain-containing protein [Planctomycetota bacterium]